MKKFLLSLIALILVVGCSSATAKSAKESATYIESVDKYSFNALKLVDKESGCKYLILVSPSSGRTNVTQMLGKDGLPLCE